MKKPVREQPRELWLARLDAAPEIRRGLIQALAYLRALALEGEHRAVSWDAVLRQRGKVDQLDELLRQIEANDG
jgi:hypothetical protein